MKGQIKNLVYGVLLFSTIILGFSFFGAEISLRYGATNATNSTYMDKSIETMKMVNSMSSSVQNSTDITSTVWGYMINPIAALRLIFSTGNIVQGIATDVTGLGFPSWTGMLIIGLASITIVFAILEASTRVKW